MGARSGVCGLGLALLVCLCSMTASAAWDVQNITLNPGWNAIHLYVQPEDNLCDEVFAGIPVRSVWYWNEAFTPVQFVRDPDELLPEEPGWLTYFSDASRQGFLTDLFAVHAGKSYLVELDSESPVTLSIYGKTALRKHEWVANSFNLVGADVHPVNPPTLKSYFDEDEATAGQDVYRLGSNGKWVKVVNKSITKMKRGEAYWVYCEGTSTYNGPLVVETETRDGLDFAQLLGEQRLTIKNNSSETREITIKLNPTVTAASNAKSTETEIAGDVPLSILRLLLWTPFEEPVTFSMEPESEQDILLGVRRGVMASDGLSNIQYASVLEVTDNAGDFYQVPVLAQKALSSTGLWVGEVELTEVSETGNTSNPTTTYPAASEFRFRVIVHIDNDGQARLLSEVILMQADDDSGTDPADDSNLVRYVLATDPDLIPSFTGIRTVDGNVVGRRLSTPVFGFTEPQLMSGKLTTSLSANILMDYDDPLNPFVHRYHTDHNNLDERFNTLLPEGYESFTFTRAISMSFTATDPTGENPPGWGHDIIGGNYREKVTGVHKRAIYVEGTFLLKKVSDVGVLNDGL